MISIKQKLLEYGVFIPIEMLTLDLTAGLLSKLHYLMSFLRVKGPVVTPALPAADLLLLDLPMI